MAQKNVLEQESGFVGGRVFISYSRRDNAVAESLKDQLAKAGFEVFIDVHDIAPAEPWRERISALISKAEKIVLLISPDFAASEVCAWEIDEAERLGKTLVPIEIKATDPTSIPGRLSRLNFLQMRNADERATGLPRLVETLKTDLAWERERTRLDELAAAWEAQDRDRRRLLLSESDLRAAEQWRDTPPKSATPLTTRQTAFLRESRRARSAQQQLRTYIAAGVAAAMAGLAVFVFGLKQQEATAKLQALQAAQETKRQLVFMMKNCPGGLPPELSSSPPPQETE